MVHGIGCFSIIAVRQAIRLFFFDERVVYGLTEISTTETIRKVSFRLFGHVLGMFSIGAGDERYQEFLDGS